MTDWKAVQLRLQALGFNPGPIDGVRGPRTDAAIVAFKKSVGLRPRPYFGPLTQAVLFQRPLPDSDLPWMEEAEAVRGLHERRDTGKLKLWFHKSVAWIDPREIPWCGAFVQSCILKAIPDAETPANPLGARQWLTFGKSTHPTFGAILVFWRGSRHGIYGHVGFYHAEDSSHFHVLGGNQADAVTITRVSKDRLLGSRWPSGWAVKSNPIHVSPNGVPITTNEA